ncbi:MAG: Holliday junction branch migration protein RuvA [Clostridia bacterium]|nr:Holliday junction branch migration protein RuvA [Clostridia bacterium]
MYSYIKGSLEIKSNGFIVIDNNGIGYKIFMSENGIETLGEIGDNVKVYTYYHVREDNISLFGFTSNEELRMFELLISVSGVGAKSAINMLSSITPSDFALAIISNDISSLIKVPGIGAKSAQRIILELKDKLKTEEAISKADSKIKVAIKQNNNSEEAIAALQVLGYNKKEVEKVIEKIDTTALSVEDIIRRALVHLAK